MICGLNGRPAFATPRERTDFDGRFGIDREPQDLLLGIGVVIDPVHLLKDGVSFWDFF